MKSVYDLVKVALMVVKTFETAVNPSVKAVKATPDLVNVAYAVSDLVKSASDLVTGGENLPNGAESV